ncbi:MAG: hypothetical protein SOZ52_02725 [Pyramidobacter sp.]|nr:hypothetical protein [Pyramidobacter sp.]
MSFRSWCLAALITVFSVGVTCAAPSDYLFVEAEGEAAVINNDIAGAKAAAKRALYRNAVEKGIGASVHGITKMKDFEVLYDKVYSQAQGVVTSSEIFVSELRGDIYYMSGRCKVARSALNGVLGPALIEAMGNPRVVLLVSGFSGDRSASAFRAGEEVSGIFYKAGYMMLDSAQIAALNAEQLREEVLRSNPQALRTLVSATGADVILSARVVNSLYAKQRVEGIPIYAVQSSVQLKAISAQNAHILAESRADAKAQGVSEGAAADKAMAQAAKKAADPMTYMLAYSLVNGSAGALAGRTVSVTVDTISFGDSRKLKNTLENASGVVSVFQRSFSSGTLKLDVVTSGTAEDLAVVLEEAGAEIRDVTQDTVSGIWQEQQ